MELYLKYTRKSVFNTIFQHSELVIIEFANTNYPHSIVSIQVKQFNFNSFKLKRRSFVCFDIN